ncbi:MAG: NAD(P)-dependent alcohol dehydrogenase [Rhodospirillaceae bacterium]|nr:MAG: NAD(P)-dependent alcohol dehydrogenase [Rhodospirillaceae bacterium]
MSNPLSRRAVLGTAAAISALGSAHAANTIRVYESGDSGGGTVTLRMVKRPAPVAGPGQVVMKVHATGLNARDRSLLRGVRIYGGAGKDLARIPFDDNAGVVLSVGAGVTRVKPGDHVICTHFPLWTDGAWDDATMSKIDFGVNVDGFCAEQAVVPADGLVKIPDSLSFEQASTLPNAGLTAWNAVVVEAQPRPGETVLTLGTGGVSVFCMQWAKMLGARVGITSSSDNKLARMKQLGADFTINYRTTPNWNEAALAQTGGKGLDVVFNTVGIGEMERAIKASASNGRIMLIGANSVTLSGDNAQPVGLKDFPRNMIMRRLRVQGVLVGSRKMLEDAVAAIAEKNIKPIIDKTYSFDQVIDALNYMEIGGKVGKIVIKVA